MEFPQMGQQCSDPHCKNLDFLPLKCQCGIVFCSKHFVPHALECPEVQVQNDPDLCEADPIYTCSHPVCKSTSYVPLICEECKKHFCVMHRHIEECYKVDPAVVAAEVEKFAAPIRQFEEAKAVVDKEIEKSIGQARKKQKTAETAIKVQLMRIKNKATGLKSIPLDDRVYFTIQKPNSVNVEVFPIFLAKTWTVGRAVDAVAAELKVTNNNNQQNSPKLRLFKRSGEILTRDMSEKVENLMIKQTLINGDDLILNYVSNDCVDLN